MKKILLTAGFTLFAWGSTCLAQSTYFSDSKEWLRKAEACKPELSYQTISPVKVVRSVQDTKAFQGWRMPDNRISSSTSRSKSIQPLPWISAIIIPAISLSPSNRPD